MRRPTRRPGRSRSRSKPGSPRRAEPAEVAIRINSKEAAKGTVPRTAVFGLTAKDRFEVGMDSYSPVLEAYVDRKPFRFNGKIDKVQFTYLK